MSRATIFAIALFLMGCGTAHVSSVNGVTAVAPVHNVAMMPGGGLLADAVAVELSSRGLTIVDPTSTSSMMAGLNLTEVEITQPQGLAKLKKQGIDAILIVRSAASAAGDPQSASARMISTESGVLIAGVTWQNGWGGQSGSIADRAMRKGLSDAAAQIASELASRIPSQART